jgi:hypothetical protein
MAAVQYNGWLIEAQSYKSDAGRWRPKAIVSISEGGTVRTYQVTAPPNVTFDTEPKADAYAVPMAKKWIEDNG